MLYFVCQFQTRFHAGLMRAISFPGHVMNVRSRGRNPELFECQNTNLMIFQTRKSGKISSSQSLTIKKYALLKPEL